MGKPADKNECVASGYRCCSSHTLCTVLRRQYGVPNRRCGHSSDVADRVDAQSCAHDCGEFPSKRSPRAVAVGCKVLYGSPHRWRHSFEQSWGDIASNNHGWQWTAGTGTDAAPFFRVFNPTSQSEKFDPTGEYLRQWIPEIADLDNSAIHAPWELGLLAPAAYPAPMVDHAIERLEALSRYKSVSGK